MIFLEFNFFQLISFAFIESFYMAAKHISECSLRLK